LNKIQNGDILVSANPGPLGKISIKMGVRYYYAPPHRAEALCDDARLTSVCLSRTSGHTSGHLDCLLGLYWTRLTLLNGFTFLV